MGLVRYGLAVGLGYLLGRPEGRERLARVRRQAADLSQRPEVVALQERGKGMVTDQAQAVMQKIMRRSKDTDSAAEPADAVSKTRSAAARLWRGLSAPSWRPPFSRSRTVHFPASEDVTPPTGFGGTTVMEDSEAAVLGTPVAPRQEPPTSPIDRP